LKATHPHNHTLEKKRKENRLAITHNPKPGTQTLPKQTSNATCVIPINPYTHPSPLSTNINSRNPFHRHMQGQTKTETATCTYGRAITSNYCN
jgi:hypothetical protein